MNPLVGRIQEAKELERWYHSEKSEFIAVYGRRRVGKTFLIRKFFNNEFSFQLTGLANVDKQQQLTRFHTTLVRHSADLDWEPDLPTDWFSAFEQLRNYLENRTTAGKQVIFLDEVPWLATQKSNFLSALEHFWNSWASAREDIMLIVCGSAAAWMLKNLIKNRGGLHNRITGRIKLNPFTLSEVESFLELKNAVYNRYQTILLYMAFGGIPFYLEYIRPEKSAMQNINDLCFLPDAPFRLEYENLYASLFSKHERHLSVIEVLAKKGKGLNRAEIVKHTQLSDGGGLTRILHELEESNFIRYYKTFGAQKNKGLYQLVDLYSLFYLRFIKRADRDDTSFWLNSIETPSFFSWSGYAFEMVVLHHVPQIKKVLGISGVQTSISTWQAKEAQIDLIIDRKDQVINLCEMKFSIHPFAIDKKYAAALQNKLGVFRQATNTQKALFLTMISTYGLAANKYSGMVHNSLTMDVLFESV